MGGVAIVKTGRNAMKPIAALRLGLVRASLGFAAVLAAGSIASAPVRADTTLNALFMKQAAYSEDDIRAMTTDFEKANPGVKVNLEFVPYEALHDKIVAAQGSGAKGYDVVLFDVIWPAEFAKNGFLQDVSARIPSSEDSQIFDGAWSTVTYDGKRWGMPWILDTKYLFYNKSMLEKAGIASPPKTWEELLQQAKTIKDKGIVKFPIVWSWAQAEAIICDYTTLVAAYKGDFFEQGKPVFDQGGALDAVKYMEQSLKDGLTNPNSREYLEEDVRKVFSNGDAAFALNWTYMYNMANDPKESKVAGQVDLVPAPGIAGKTDASAVNGSMALGITSNGGHPEEAWKYIAFMTSQPVQNKYAKLSLPIWKSSYDDPAVAKGQESLIAAAKKSINIMYPRPTTASYTELSNILQKNLQQVLLGQATPEEGMQTAAKAAARLH
jgi:multiple sugar transport system substrate-binding protein